MNHEIIIKVHMYMKMEAGQKVNWHYPEVPWLQHATVKND